MLAIDQSGNKLLEFVKISEEDAALQFSPITVCLIVVKIGKDYLMGFNHWRKGSDFTVKTTVHIHRLFEKFGFDGVFGRSAVMEILELKSSGASKLLSNLVQADIIEPVSGHGKGKYKFKK